LKSKKTKKQNLAVSPRKRNGKHKPKTKKVEKKKSTHTHELELVIMLIKNAINMKSVSKYDFSK
jgi:hypothetical protein